MDKKNLLINGPLNVARIEGKVNGVTKVLYLFMDIHYSENLQTECEDINSTDIDKYIIQQFDNFHKNIDNNKMLDMFVEIRQNQLEHNKSDYSEIHRGIYIQKIFKLFKNQYSSNKNKMSYAKDFKHVRLHHMDFRDYLPAQPQNSITNLENLISNMYNGSLNITYINNFINSVKIIEDFTTRILSILKSPIKNNTRSKIYTTNKGIHITKLSDDERMDIFSNLIYKIKNIYNNDKVHKILVSEFDSYLIPLYEKFIESIKKTLVDFTDMKHTIEKLQYRKVNIDYGSIYHIPYNILRSMEYTIDIDINKLSLTYTSLHAKIVDYYMMRRLLDKDYITNSLSYTGAAHSVHIMKFLLQHFNFKITHMAKSPDIDLNKVKMDIINTKNENTAQQYVFPPDDYQCSDLTNFPKNFE